VAEGFGLKARSIETPGELQEALDEAFAWDGPFFVDVKSESLLTELPPVLSWLRAAERQKAD
jgi:acetolactate synthase-1/2/3 large subunit